MCAKSLQLCLTPASPWTMTGQTPLSVGFSRQEYSSGLPCPPPGGLPNPEIKPMSLASPALSVGTLLALPGKPQSGVRWLLFS